MVLEKTLASPLDCKEIQPVHPKGDQSWVFFGRTDAEAETPILWPPHVKSWLIGKDSDAGRGWGQEEKGKTEDEMAGWHHWLDGRESEWTPGVGNGQGGLACCNSWGRKESDTTERLNWTEKTRKRKAHENRTEEGQRKVWGPEWGLQVEQHSWLSLICIGQTQGEENIKGGAKRSLTLSLSLYYPPPLQPHCHPPPHSSLLRGWILLLSSK